MSQTPTKSKILTPKGAVVPLGVLLRAHGVPGRNARIAYKCELYGLGASTWANKKLLCFRRSSASNSWIKLPFLEVKALSASLDRARYIVLDFDQVWQSEVGTGWEIGLERAEFAPLPADSQDLYLCDLNEAEVLNESGQWVGKVKSSYAVSPHLPQSSHNLVVQGAQGFFELPLAWVDLVKSKIVSFGMGSSTLVVPQVEQWFLSSDSEEPHDAD